MAGIYLHIPFCKQACYYCNFHFSTSLTRKNEMVSALLAEMEAQQHYISGEPVETIYFGGGTPSLLSIEELERLMDGLRNHFRVEPDAEITLEVNPDDVDRLSGKLEAWRAAGINRLSIGVQSFYEEDLRWMNRAHNAAQAISCIQQARDAGFDNISMDLIYGSPTLPDEHWARNVEQALALQIPHLSCYALTVEPRTALDKMIRTKKVAAVDPDTQARQFLLLMDWLTQAGYEHYEISNFALPGKRSRHNSSYWQGKPYLGLGPSAHSFNGSSRQWNAANNALYIDTLLGKVPGQPQADTSRPSAPHPLVEKEVLTPVQQLNEYIMISLRTTEGTDTAIVSARFGTAAASALLTAATSYIRTGKLRTERTLSGTEKLILTSDGKLLADGIAADLFFDKIPE